MYESSGIASTNQWPRSYSANLSNSVIAFLSAVTDLILCVGLVVETKVRMPSVKIAYIIGTSFLFFIVSLFLFLIIKDGYDPLAVVMMASFAAFMIIHQGVTNYTVRKNENWFQIDLIFLLMFFLVHFWLWIAVQYGFAEGIWKSTAYLGRVNYAVALSLLGMAAFLLGFNLKTNINAPQAKGVIFHVQWEKLGFILFYAGAGLTVSYALFFGASAFEGGYAGSEVGGLGTRSIYLLQGILLKLGILILLILNADNESFIPKCRIPLLVLASVLGMFLVLGDRSEFLYTLAVVLFAYTRYFRRIPLSVLVVGFVAIIFMMSVVQFSRKAETRSLSTMYEVAGSNSSSISTTQGLNGISVSGKVLLGAVNAVPKHHAYFYGDLKIVELLGIIPYGRTLFLDLVSSQKFGTSSDFLTWYIRGPNSKTGTGTTIVADLYLDYGPFGVVTGLFLLGFIANYVHIKASHMDTMVNAVIFCYFAGLLTVLPRYNFLMIIRGLIWPVIFLWVMRPFIEAQPIQRTGGKL